MSYRTYIDYGYGVNFGALDITSDAVKFRKFLEEFAPEVSKSVAKDMLEVGIKEPEMDDYEEFFEDDFGIIGIIKEVLEEYSGLTLFLCTDYDYTKYIIYMPSYPWQLSERERKLELTDLDAIFEIINNILDGTVVEATYQEVENGG